jgi:ABC-type glycerol-3-phosphate transport system permease component
MTERAENVVDEPEVVTPAAQRARPPTAPSLAAHRRTAVLRGARRWLVWVPLAALLIWTLAPLVVSISISFKTPSEVLASPDLIPNNPTLDGYREVWAREGFRRALVNSVIIGFGSLVLALLVAVPAAYALARFRFLGRHWLLLFIIVPLFIPKVSIMAPLYQLAVRFGLLDTKIVLIVVFTAMLLPLATWLMVGFFQAIPRELEEAAAVDGASMWQTIRRIILPLALPALITVAVLAFREAWNEFELVLALTQGDVNRTLPYELWRMRDDIHVPNEPAEAAFALMTIVPLLLVYLRIERYVVSGIMSGSVK